MSRQENKKFLIIEYLKYGESVERACFKANVARASYYRWRADDKRFKKITDTYSHGPFIHKKVQKYHKTIYPFFMKIGRLKIGFSWKI